MNLTIANSDHPHQSILVLLQKYNRKHCQLGILVKPIAPKFKNDFSCNRPAAFPMEHKSNGLAVMFLQKNQNWLVGVLMVDSDSRIWIDSWMIPIWPGIRIWIRPLKGSWNSGIRKFLLDQTIPLIYAGIRIRIGIRERMLIQLVIHNSTGQYNSGKLISLTNYSKTSLKQLLSGFSLYSCLSGAAA